MLKCTSPFPGTVCGNTSMIIWSSFPRPLDPNHDRYVRDLAAVEPILIIRTTTNGAHGMLERLKLDKISRATSIERLETVIGRILEDIKRIRHLHPTLHAPGPHCLGDIRRATSVLFLLSRSPTQAAI